MVCKAIRHLFKEIELRKVKKKVYLLLKEEKDVLAREKKGKRKAEKDAENF